jgi:hypothetical protein
MGTPRWQGVKSSCPLIKGRWVLKHSCSENTKSSLIRVTLSMTLFGTSNKLFGTLDKACWPEVNSVAATLGFLKRSPNGISEKKEAPLSPDTGIHSSKFMTSLCNYLFFFPSWVLNSGPCTCSKQMLYHSSTPPVLFALVILQLWSHTVCLGHRSSQSPSPK